MPFTYTKLYLLPGLLIVFGLLSAAAQDNVRIQRLSVEDGLSQSSIRSMRQDSSGYLWIGTRDGINRYDGTSFRVFPKLSADNHIVEIVVDDQASLWVSTLTSLHRYNPISEKFEDFPMPDSLKNNNGINDIVFSPPSSVWLATDHGVMVFDTNEKVYHLPAKYRQLRDQSITKVATHRSLGLLVLGEKALLDGELKPIFKWDSTVVRYATRIAVADNGDVYFSDNANVYLLASGETKAKLFYKFPPNRFIEELEAYQDDGVWVGYLKLYRLNKKGKVMQEISHNPLDPYSLSGDYVIRVYTTTDGTIWVGTNGYGLNKIDLSFSRFDFIGDRSGSAFALSHPYVNFVLTKNDSLVFVSTGENGVDQLDMKRRKRTRLFRIPEDVGTANPVTTMFLDENNLFWLGTRYGLYTGHSTSDLKKIPFFARHSIYTICRIRNEFLIATNGGIYTYDHKKNAVRTIRQFPTQAYDHYPAYWDGKYIWEASHRSLKKLDLRGTVVHEFTNQPGDSTSLLSNDVKCIFKDSKKRTWIGTWGGGLSLYDSANEKFKSYTIASGLPNDVVYGLLEDKKGNLWMSTNRGLSCFDPETEHFTNYTADDGLQGDEFNTLAYFQSPKGKMYFGGIKGLTSFYPDKVLSFPDIQPVPQLNHFYINEFPSEINNPGLTTALIQRNRNVTLPAGTRSFAFEVSSIAFANPAKIHYRYKLVPFNDDWVEIDNRRYINFTNIPPGEYTFVFAPSTMKNEWSKNELRIHITILAPFWKRPWMIVLLSLLCVALVYVINRYRMRMYRLRTERLEELVSTRTRELQVKNEEVAAQNEELASLAEQLGTRNDELSVLKTDLEYKVNDRTRELKIMNGELLSKNTQLEQFSFIIAHNLNGPVARIKGLINLFELGISGPDLHAKLNTSVDDLQQVINDLGSILNLMYGVKDRLESIQLAAIIRDTLKSLEDDVKKTKAEVIVQVSPDLNVLGIRPYLHSIFFNLIQNAMKYGKHDRPLKITIDAQASEEKVTIRIADNGIGIDMRYAEQKLFKLYQRFQTQVPGRGLGLYLVKTQTEILGGHISVDSVPDAGTTFSITFARA